MAMRHIIAAAALAVAIGCAASVVPPTTPSPAAPPIAPRPIVLDGTWNGRGIDSKGETSVSWQLTQTGTSVSGTVRTLAVDPEDGSCNSCHRNKRGTITGTISGSTLTISMFFAAGADGDPTPECSATLTGSAADIADNSIAAAYSGSDTCEGPVGNGVMTMNRNSAARVTSPRRGQRD